MEFLLRMSFTNIELLGLLLLVFGVLGIWFFEKTSSVAVFLYDQRKIKLGFCLLGILCAVCGMCSLGSTVTSPEFGLINDGWAKVGRLVLSVMLFLVVGLDNKKISWVNCGGGGVSAELFLIMSLLFSVSVLVSTIHLVLLVIFFETISLLMYVLALRNSSKDLVLGEAVLKYVLASGLSSGLLYLGMYFIFCSSLLPTSLSGWSDPSAAWVSFVFGSRLVEDLLLGIDLALNLVGAVCIVTGFSFKFGLFPFHAWMPDLYQGLSLQGLGYFMLIPKVAFFFALLRLEIWFAGSSFLSSVGLSCVFIIFGVLSVVLGAVMMFGQFNLKRLLAFSSIHNFGYIFVALGLGSTKGLIISTTFLIFYILVTIGLLLVLKQVSLPLVGDLTSDIRLFIGSLPVSHRKLSYILFVYLFILLGLPLSFGFVVKAQVILSLCSLEHEFFNGVFLAVVLMFCSFLSVIVYLRLLVECFFNNNAVLQTPPSVSPKCGGAYDLLLFVIILSIAFYFSFGWCFTGYDFLFNVVHCLFIF